MKKLVVSMFHPLFPFKYGNSAFSQVLKKADKTMYNVPDDGSNEFIAGNDTTGSNCFYAREDISPLGTIRFLKFVIPVFIIALFPHAVFSQGGECLSGGCTYLNNQFPPGSPISTTSNVFTIINNEMWAGEHALCYVTSGQTYEWSLCQADGGIASYDAQLTLYNGSTNAIICYSDDYCGSAPKIHWTATFTGNVKIQINEYNCSSNSTLTTLVWRRVTMSNLTDIEVGNIYSMGTISTDFSNPHVVTAWVKNIGNTTVNSLLVTLNVSGSNSFSNTQTISSISSGDSVLVTFTGYNSTNTGTNTVMVSVPNDDNNSNNSNTVQQIVTTNSSSYAYGSTIGITIGFNGVSGDIAAKFHSSVQATLHQVNVPFGASGVGEQFVVKIWNANGPGGTPGTLLHTSSVHTSNGSIVNVNISNPVNVNGDFYVGITQLNNFYALGTQIEIPVRTAKFYYTIPAGSTNWVEFSNQELGYRLMPEIVLVKNVTDIEVGNIYTMGTISTQSSNPHVVSAWIKNPGNNVVNSFPVTLNVSGNNSFNNIQTVTSLSPGDSILVTFSGYISNNTGSNTITVSVPNDDDNSNNSQTVQQLVTNNSMSYAYGSIVDLGGGITNNNSGDIATKFHTSIQATIGQVKVPFSSQGAGVQFIVKIWDANGQGGTPGTLLHTSTVQTSNGNLVTVDIINPVSVSGDFFVGVTQINNFIALGVQREVPIRTAKFYFTVPAGSNNWLDFSSQGINLRTMVEPVFSCPLPDAPGVISGPLEVCKNKGYTYSIDPISNATHYNWFLPPGWTGTSNTNTITVQSGLSGGNISVTAVNQCGTSPGQSIAILMDQPSVPAITQVGEELYSSAASGNQWYLNSNLIPGAVNQKYIPLVTGLYSVTVTNNSGCSESSVGYNFTISSLNSNTLAGKNIHIYPNPAKDMMNIVLEGISKPENIVVTNILGQTIIMIPSYYFYDNTYRYDIRDLSQGVYFISLKSEDYVLIRKFVVQK